MTKLQTELMAVFAVLSVAIEWHSRTDVRGFRPASIANMAPSIPSALQRSLDDPQNGYFPRHVNEFLRFARQQQNWVDANGSAEPDNAIPGVLISGSTCSLTQPVTIRPARDTHTLKHWKKGHPGPSDFTVPSFGYIVARISNPNPCATIPIGFPPGYSYWVVRSRLVPKPPPQQPDTVYESFIIGDASPSLGKAGTFERCNNPDHSQPNDFADVFLQGDTCSDALIASVERSALDRERYHFRVGQQLRLHLFQLRGARTLSDRLPFDPRLDDIALWFACDAGCCYAENL